MSAQERRWTRRLVSAALLLVAGCGSVLPSRGASIVGTVVSLGDHLSFSQSSNTVHVTESASDPCGIIFLVSGDTRIWRQNSHGVLTRAGYGDLAAGQTVRVWADGVLKSCPGQATAQVIEILSS